MSSHTEPVQPFADKLRDVPSKPANFRYGHTRSHFHFPYHSS